MIIIANKKAFSFYPWRLQFKQKYMFETFEFNVKSNIQRMIAHKNVPRPYPVPSTIHDFQKFSSPGWLIYCSYLHAKRDKT